MKPILLWSIIPTVVLFVCGLVGAIILLYQSSNDHHYQHNQHDPTSYESRMSIKTPYRFIENNSTEELKFEGCEAQKIWFMFRHGTRTPDRTILDKIEWFKELQKKLIDGCNSPNEKCKLEKDQLERLKGWSTTLSKLTAEEILVEEGEREMYGLSARFKKRFPHLIPDKYDNETFIFKSTNTSRTIASAEHFTIGLFGPNARLNVSRSVLDRNPALEFHELCEKWIEDLKKKSPEADKLKNSKLANETIKSISDRLGNMTLVQAFDIYFLCAYETAFNETKKSPWCLFTDAEYQFFELVIDIQSFEGHGLINSLNYEQSCPAFTDMFEFLTNKNSTAKTSAYFSHNKVLIKMRSFLRMTNESLQYSDDVLTKYQLRDWRMSKIGAFASNFAFVYYNCSTAAGPGIVTLHQERLINLPGCPANVPCPLETLKKNYAVTKDKCDFNKMCAVNVY